MKDGQLTLANAVDARHFAAGDPIRLATLDGGEFRRATRFERAHARLCDAWQSATRWWRLRSVVSAVDRNAGTVEVYLERWSWRRWRWERVVPIEFTSGWQSMEDR